MSMQADLHNRIAGEALTLIIRPIIEAGGGMPEIMVVIESVIVGAMRFGVKTGEANLLDAFMMRVKDRLAEHRLGESVPGGSA